MNFRQRLALGHLIGEFQVGLFERFAEAPHPIAVLANILPLGLVQDVAYVGARVAARLHQGYEVFDKLLEEDVVLPERIVGVDHQGVASHEWLDDHGASRFATGIVPSTGNGSGASRSQKKLL